MNISSEQLAYWYLRLNGFLTTANFVVHPDRGTEQRTDVDVLGVRFPYRAENLERPMEDEPRFTCFADKIVLRIAEVKTEQCALNGPWTNPARGNMLRVLLAVGLLPEPEARVAAEALHRRGWYSNQLFHIALTAFGREENPTISKAYPDVEQIRWEQVLTFIHRRFRDYRREKRSHGQWDVAGRQLWDAADQSRSLREFIKLVRVVSPETAAREPGDLLS